LFADRSETIKESSGTAGIAAAMAIGVRRGWLGPEAEVSAMKAFEGLKTRLTPDGFIIGTSPSNKHQGGEVFQAESQGIIGKWTMGLFAQLAAELDPPKQ
uniref:glycoside hydrolase family 88 protein n=1 Tax=Aquiflexum sp. TaxID=1872584 RepID=UPI0035938631